MRAYPCLLATAVAVLSAISASAESYHVTTVGELDFAPDQDGLEEVLDAQWSGQWAPLGARLPEAVEAYVAGELEGDGRRRFRAVPQRNLQLAVRFSEAQPTEGFIDLLDMGSETMVKGFSIKLDPAKLKPATREEFEQVRRNSAAGKARYRKRPGRSWFQHVAREPGSDEVESARMRVGRMERELSPTFAMFSGGRAIAENLALDRELILGRAVDAPDVPLADIQGITVKAIDWSERLPDGAEIEVCALAKALPLDQHALFLPSVDQLFQLVDVVEDEGAPVIGMFDARNPFSGLPTRYLEQLGLADREQLAGLPIKSIAVTGGDPFFPTGTDVAVLLECGDPQEVSGALPKLEGQFKAVIGNVVVASNSEVQIDRLKAVAAGRSPSLGSSDEFKFFRHRYPVGAAEESAFAFLSDATIRRWGGPRFRIAASRRVRAMAALGELSVRQIAGEELGDDFAALLGKVHADGAGRVHSEHYGVLGAITPVSGIRFDTVTAAEKTGYEAWRRGYESGWARVFDPIAIRIALDQHSRALDLTVLPLTIDSEYREWLDLAGEAVLTQLARNPHPEALLFASFAVDSTSESFINFNVGLTGLMPALKIKPLSWVGQSVSFFLEDAPLWETAGTPEGEIELEEIGKLPVGVRVESKSSFKLAAFLAALKGLSMTSAPDLLSWETRKHGERTYVAVIGNGDQIGTEVSLYYAATPTALLVSLNEEILKRAIDREAAGADLGEGDLPQARHALLNTSPQFLAKFAQLSNGVSFAEERRDESWSALPILNEWHRRHPEVAPQEFHQRIFAEAITCPGGKGYRWNAGAMTMESVAYGFPAMPRDEAEPVAVMERFNALRAGLGFEDDGLRLRVTLEGDEDESAVAPGE